jgi:hypothetical protein
VETDAVQGLESAETFHQGFDVQKGFREHGCLGW